MTDVLARLRTAMLDVMRREGVAQDADGVQPQPGIWLRRVGDALDEVDLMVPAVFAGAGGRRSVRLPPHSNRAARRAIGLEGVLVDNDLLPVRAMAPDDDRAVHVRVAGQAAMLVAKLFKLQERADARERTIDKDAHDVFRVLTGTGPEDLQRRYRRLLADEVSCGRWCAWRNPVVDPWSPPVEPGRGSPWVSGRHPIRFGG